MYKIQIVKILQHSKKKKKLSFFNNYNMYICT